MSKNVTLTQEQYDALVARASHQQTIRFKVSEKGGVSVYGLNAKWPVTLYAGQWARLFAEIEALKAFIAANQSKLATKPAADTPAQA